MVSPDSGGFHTGEYGALYGSVWNVARPSRTDPEAWVDAAYDPLLRRRAGRRAHRGGRARPRLDQGLLLLALRRPARAGRRRDGALGGRGDRPLHRGGRATNPTRVAASRRCSRPSAAVGRPARTASTWPPSPRVWATSSSGSPGAASTTSPTRSSSTASRAPRREHRALISVTSVLGLEQLAQGGAASVIPRRGELTETMLAFMFELRVRRASLSVDAPARPRPAVDVPSGVEQPPQSAAKPRLEQPERGRRARGRAAGAPR